ncbi:MAG: SoxR reducing system RseC family protein [Methylophilus sp.]
MIEEQAVILSVETLEDNPKISVATLEIERKTACGLCGKTRGCGNAIWGKLFAHQTTAFKAQNLIHANVGQSVIVGINEKALLKSALLLYLFPLVTMLTAAIIAIQVSNTDMNAMIGALIGLLLGFIWVKGYTTSNQYFLFQQPVILRLANLEAEIKFS